MPNSVAAIHTSPPYNIGQKYQGPVTCMPFLAMKSAILAQVAATFSYGPVWMQTATLDVGNSQRFSGGLTSALALHFSSMPSLLHF